MRRHLSFLKLSLLAIWAQGLSAEVGPNSAAQTTVQAGAGAGSLTEPHLVDTSIGGETAAKSIIGPWPGQGLGGNGTAVEEEIAGGQGRQISIPASINMPVVVSSPSLAPSTAHQEDSGLLPGGPNDGKVEYVALAGHNTVPGLVVPNTQFGVPYVEFTSTSAAIGQVAEFHGAAEVALVINGVVQYPFRPNPQLSSGCQVVVRFRVIPPDQDGVGLSINNQAALAGSQSSSAQI